MEEIKEYLNYQIEHLEKWDRNKTLSEYGIGKLSGFKDILEQLTIHGVMPSVIYLVTNEDKMTVESAHWKLEDAKKEVDDWAKNQPQFTFMVVETEIH